jgi:hypothetical protein
MLLPKHRYILLKQMRYVQTGLPVVSDPPGIMMDHDMYRVVGIPPKTVTRLLM